MNDKNIDSQSESTQLLKKSNMQGSRRQSCRMLSSIRVNELKQKKEQLRISMHGIITVSYISNAEHSINGRFYNWSEV